MPTIQLARVTLYQFNQLSGNARLAAALYQGTYLATRWPAAEEAVNLYALHGFFAEVVYDTGVNQLLGLRSFKDLEGLEAYVANMRLPKWLSEG